MGPELSDAVFTVFFHHWNSKISEETTLNVETCSFAEKFGFGDSVEQSLSCNKFYEEGKWVNRKSLAGDHFLVAKITTYRMLKAVFDFKYLIDIVSSKKNDSSFKS